MEQPIEQQERVATAFGRALDSDDFNALQELLAPDCRYELGDETLHGPEAIAASYRQAMERGRDLFDELIWGESRVDAANDGNFWVYFHDLLRHRGREHTYRCRQRLVIDDRGLITAIRHDELPGEREAVEAFKKETGLG